MGRGTGVELRAVADAFGIAGSSACALHCLAVPVLLVTGTVLPGSFATDETFHRMLVWAIVPASLLAFSIGCWRHRDRGVLWLAALGLCGLVASIAIPHEVLGEVGERLLTLGSAGLLIGGHLRNFQRCRASACDHEEVAR